MKIQDMLFLCTGHQTRTQCPVRAHVIFSVFHSLSCHQSSHAQHMHVAQVTMECCAHQNICLHIQRSMTHSTPSLMVPPSLSTSSLLTRTPTRPSTRPSTGPLQISFSGDIYRCDDPINVSCLGRSALANRL